MRRTWWLGALAGLAVSLGACGGDDQQAAAPPGGDDPSFNAAGGCPTGKIAVTVGDAKGGRTTQCLTPCPANQHYGPDLTKCVSNSSAPTVTAVAVKGFGVTSRNLADNDPFKMKVKITVAGEPFASSVRPYIKVPVRYTESTETVKAQDKTSDFYVCSPGAIPIKHTIYGTEEITAEATGSLTYECLKSLREGVDPFRLRTVGGPEKLPNREGFAFNDAFAFELAFDPDGGLRFANTANAPALPANLLATWRNMSAFTTKYAEKPRSGAAGFVDRIAYLGQRKVTPTAGCIDAYGAGACTWDVHGPPWSSGERKDNGLGSLYRVTPQDLSLPGRALAYTVLTTDSITLPSSAVTVESDLAKGASNPALAANVAWTPRYATSDPRGALWRNGYAQGAGMFVRPSKSEVPKIRSAFGDEKNWPTQLATSAANRVGLEGYLLQQEMKIDQRGDPPSRGRTESGSFPLDGSTFINTPLYLANTFDLMSCVYGERAVFSGPADDLRRYPDFGLLGYAGGVLDRASKDLLQNPPPCATTSFVVKRVGGSSFAGRIPLPEDGDGGSEGSFDGSGSGALSTAQSSQVTGTCDAAGGCSSRSTLNLGTGGSIMQESPVALDVGSSSSASGGAGTGSLKLDLFGINVVSDPAVPGSPQANGSITIPITDTWKKIYEVKKLLPKQKVGEEAREDGDGDVGIAWHFELKWGPICGPEGCVTLIGDLYAGAFLDASATLSTAPGYPCVSTNPNVPKCYKAYPVAEDDFDPKNGSGLTLEDAASFCAGSGGRLAEIKSDAEATLARTAVTVAEQARAPVANLAGVRPRPWLGLEKTTAYLYNPRMCPAIVAAGPSAATTAYARGAYNTCLASGQALWGFTQSQTRVWSYDSNARQWAAANGAYNKLSAGDAANDAYGGAVLDAQGNWVGVSASASARNYPLCEYPAMKSASGYALSLDVEPSLAGGADIKVIYGDPDVVGVGIFLGINLIKASLGMNFGGEWRTLTDLADKRTRITRISSSGQFDLTALSGELGVGFYVIGTEWEYPLFEWDGIDLYSKQLWESERDFRKAL